MGRGDKEGVGVPREYIEGRPAEATTWTGNHCVESYRKWGMDCVGREGSPFVPSKVWVYDLWEAQERAGQEKLTLLFALI